MARIARAAWTHVRVIGVVLLEPLETCFVVDHLTTIINTSTHVLGTACTCSSVCSGQRAIKQ